MSRIAKPDRLRPMTRRSRLLVLLVLAACARSAEPPPGTGGESGPAETKQESAPPPPAAPPAAAQPTPAPASEGRALDAPKSALEERAEPSTLAEAEAELALAERELESALAPGASSRAEKKGGGDGASPCERTCRAFASLSRAAAAVCRLEQPNGERCTRANDALGRARARVSSCACAP
jgi:hypothetical protein